MPGGIWRRQFGGAITGNARSSEAWISDGGVIYGASAGGGKANTDTAGTALFVGRGGTAKYGNGGHLADLGQAVAAGGLTAP
ncbi:MAG: hypothetical protein LBC88_06440 [Spirochaetaceae bacterium]|jgi:hypothetical protein|nr:hypothetical protein [Spirochaetaceae bacterium]